LSDIYEVIFCLMAVGVCSINLQFKEMGLSRSRWVFVLVCDFGVGLCVCFG